MREVAIRTDASTTIGTGHLMRCLTLADALAREGACATFYCAPAAEPWRGLVEQHGHRFMTLPLRADGRRVETQPPHADWAPWGQAADAAAVLDSIDGMLDWLIVDHYALDVRWEQALRPKAKRILAIDDLADRDHDCDMLLDHNPQDTASDRYQTRLSANATRLIGPRYALLRPEFVESRVKRLGRERTGSLRRIVVFMGGTDAAGATLMALRALSADDLCEMVVDVVIGGESPHLAAIRQAAGDRGNTRVHVDAAEIAELFAGADLAIGAGGVAALERCCVGVPTITMSVAANQEPALARLSMVGAVQHLGRLETLTVADLSSAIRGLVAAPDLHYNIAEAAGRIVDGQGMARVVAAIGIQGVV